MQSLTLHYNEQLARQAVKAFWWRRTGWSYIVASVLMFAVLCYELWEGDETWIVGVLGATLAIFIALSAAIYIVHYRGTMTRFRRMQVPEGTFELREETFRLTSDIGTSEFVWKTIIEVWRYPDFWLLLFSPAQFVTIPLADFPPAAQEFLLAKVSACGAKVS